MSWSIKNVRNDEASKIRWELVPYMTGRCLDIGAGAYKVFPHFISVDNGKEWGATGIDVRIETAEKLDIFSSQSCDCVFSSHLLEHIEEEKVVSTLREWMRVLKRGGHLILYLPDEDEYPKVGEFGSNPDHKWNINNEKMIEKLEQLEFSWDMIDFQKRNQGDEYSLFYVIKKL